jgi:hypothetical protein
MIYSGELCMSDLGERFLKHVISSEKDGMEITFQQMDGTGQVSFVFPTSNICDEDLKRDVEKSAENILRDVTPFYVSMIGQMIVRKNMSSFFDFYKNMSDDDYETKLTSMEYVSFGMGCKNGYISMVFHCSLLYNVFMALLGNTENKKEN